jgi:hypothetical protein
VPETPHRYSDNVYAAFGRAAHAAQLLEKQLATFLLLPEFAKKGKISTATFAKVQEDLDKTPPGPLVNKMKSVVQLDETFERMCEEIKTRRVHLIHHYFTDFGSLIKRPDEQIIADIDYTHKLLDLGYRMFRDVNDIMFQRTRVTPAAFYAMLMRLEQENPGT